MLGARSEWAGAESAKLANWQVMPRRGIYRPPTGLAGLVELDGLSVVGDSCWPVVIIAGQWL